MLLKRNCYVILIFVIILGVIQAQVDPDCFKQSSSTYPYRWWKADDEKMFSNQNILDSDVFNKNMKISKFRGCLDKEKRIVSLRLQFIDKTNYTNVLELDPFYALYEDDDVQCHETYEINSHLNDTYIESIHIYYNNDYVVQVRINTSDGRVGGIGVRGNAVGLKESFWTIDE